MLGRFHTVDPLAEKFSYQSTYVYANNNPIRYIDYLGMNAEETEKKREERKQRRAEKREERKKSQAIREGERKAKKEGIDHVVLEEVEIAIKQPDKEITFTLYDETYTITGTEENAEEYAKEIVAEHMNSQTNKERLRDAFSDDNTEEEPYNGYFRGIGAGGPTGGAVPHEGFFHTYEFLDWVKNNPEEAKKLLQQNYNYYKSIAEKKK